MEIKIYFYTSDVHCCWPPTWSTCKPLIEIQKIRGNYETIPWVSLKCTLRRFILAIAEVYKNEGNDEYRKQEFSNAMHFYTEGIKVNCKDDELNAKLYSNRATAHFYLGKTCSCTKARPLILNNLKGFCIILKII